MPRKVPRKGDGSEVQDTLELDLEGFTPEAYDKEGVSILLKHLFPEGCIVSAAELATYIVSHNAVGTVVKPPIDDEDDDDDDDQEIIFSVTSVVDLSSEEAERHIIVKKLRKFIIESVSKCPSTSNCNEVRHLLENAEDSRVYLLINERFDNLPLSICADAVASLPAEFKKANLSPTHLLLLSWAYKSRDSTKEKTELDYAYSELKHIRPLSLYHLEMDSKTLASETERVWDTHEELTGYNTLLLTVLEMDKFAEVLDSLKKHL